MYPVRARDAERPILSSRDRIKGLQYLELLLGEPCHYGLWPPAWSINRIADEGAADSKERIDDRSGAPRRRTTSAGLERG